jgi:hypothetical protein
LASATAIVDEVEAGLARLGDANQTHRTEVSSRNSREKRTERLLELIRSELETRQLET